MRRLTHALGAALLLAALPSVSRAQARAGHTATMLATGDVLIAGGVDNTGATLATSDIVRTSIGLGVVATAGGLTVARASHTATLMSNGCVLVAGGNTAAEAGPAVATNDVRVYNPATGLWTSPANLATARFNHTSTLLNDGRVLVCGGQDGAGTALTSCELYTPTSCTAGSWAAAASLLQARYNHTAVLLKDGRVWMAGGRNPAIVATGGYLATTERYVPSAGGVGAGLMQSASPMIEARSQHTATLMGDGKALVVGGYNLRDVLANKGITNSAEIYDPISNSVTPAASMAARRQSHATTLSADGTVVVLGGLGNITTTYIDASAEIMSGGFVTLGAPVTVPTATISGITAQIPLDFDLNKQVAGVIQDGEILMSSPTITRSWGVIRFTPASDTVPTTGIRINLAGQTVGCRPTVPQTCGAVQTAVGGGATLIQGQGQTIFYPITGITDNGRTLNAGGSITFAPSPNNESNTTSIISDGTFQLATLTIDMDADFVGYNVAAGSVLNLTAGTINQASSFTVTITSGVAVLPAATVALDVAGNPRATFTNVTFTGVTGTLTFTGQPGQTFASPQTIPVPGTLATADIAGVLRYTTSGAAVAGADFEVDVATVIIRRMVMADKEIYNPKTNEWTLSAMDGDLLLNHRWGHTGTLLRNNDVLYYGGRFCNGATCASMPARTAATRLYLLPSERNWANTAGSSPGPRALHTATLLPDGTILAAGGTNGPSILRSADTFDPETETFTPVAVPMRHVRDLHTATLLPNGRVLIAGGFTTNAASTGSTNTAEIYYPDTRVFLETQPMISSRSNHTAIMLPEGKVFVAGGFGTNSLGVQDVASDTAEIYLSTSGVWMRAQDLPAGCERALHATVQLKDGRIAMFGGVNGSGVLASVAIYDPAANSWGGSCAAVTMPTALRSHSATLLFDGSVLIAGGNDGLGEANKAYIWDPRSNTWRDTDPLPLLEPRFNHTATLLPNGNVMITGGSQKFGDVPRSVEIYHVDASSFVTYSGVDGGFLNGARAFHTMTLALNNKMYAIGGSDGVIGGTGVSLYLTAEGGEFTAPADAFSKSSPPSFRQATISGTSATPFLPGGNLTVTGIQFRGATEASGGGAASQNSSFSFPQMLLQQVDGSGGAASQSNGGFMVDLTTQIFQNAANLATLDTSLTVALPATAASMPYGWYAVRIGANDVFSKGRMVQSGPAKPTAAVTGLAGVAASTSVMNWTWNAVGPLGTVNGYNVYNATTGVFISTIPETLAPSFAQSQLDPSATCAIIVAPFTLSGDGPLAYSPTSYTLSTTPINVSIASVTFSDLLLHWNSNGNTDDATFYEVTQSSDDFVTDVSTPVPAIFNLTNTQTIIGNLTANTTYYFRVRAFNLVGQFSPYSVSVSTRTRAPVTQPIVSGRTTTSITWAWSDPGSVTNYRVYNATNSVLLGTPVSNSFTQVGLGTDTEHSIRVTAVTNAGEGPLSPSASAYTNAATPGLFLPTVSQLTTGSYLLNWSNNGNPITTDYRTSISQFDGSGNVVSSSSIGSQPGSFSQGFGGLIPSTRYGYSIVAVNGDGIDSDVPPAVTGSTWTLPAQPTGLTVLGTSPTTISVQWNANNNSSSATYQVTYSTDDFTLNIATAISFSQNYGGTSAVITGLVTSASYSIRVIASNPFGQLSQFSLPVTTRTFNGGAPFGSIQGPLLFASNSAIVGSLGNGRNVQVRAPAHTFPTDVIVTVSSFVPAGTLCPNATNIAFSIVNTPALQPIGSLYFSFDFTPPELGTIPASRALLLRYDPGSNTCVPLETTVDTTNGWMTARINHFSLFQVGQVPLSATPETARIFPNPFYTARDGFVTIDNVPPNSRVRILTLRGEQVLDVKANGNGILTWGGTNGSGRAVASGVYLVFIESGGAKKLLKLAVIR